MATTAAPKYAARLKSLYFKTAASELQKELKLNFHDVPRLEKIVINVGLGRAKDDKKVIEAATTTLRKISGQQPVVTKAKKAIASFKLRAGDKIGLKVTLRGERMYEFLDRLVTVVLPRVRDFHGVSAKSFDKQGNYNLGLVEQSVFPELSYEDTVVAHGLQIVFHIQGQGADHSRKLLEKFGMPFEKTAKAKESA